MVSIVMGSDSDYRVMEATVQILEQLAVPYEVDVVSAHRTPDKLMHYAKQARARGVQVIIAAAGGAAHLPGMVASMTPLPVIGVPILSSNSIDGWDSVLSILQMPGGVPVATVALDGAKNAGILAAQIVGVADAQVMQRIADYKAQLGEQVTQKAQQLQVKVKSDASRKYFTPPQ